MNKQQLRKSLSSRRSRLSSHVHGQFSTTIIQQLFFLLSEHHIDELLAYRSIGAEVDTSALHSGLSGLPVYAPVCGATGSMCWRASNSEYWKRSAHGTLEPLDGSLWQPSSEARSAVACPLLGFDRSGNRLGMGAGFFDRWLADHAADMQLIIGLAFGCQHVPCLPVEEHDQPLDIIITEKEIILCQNTSTSSQ